MKTRVCKVLLIVFIIALICTFSPTYSVQAIGDEGVTGLNVYTFDVGSGACSIIEFEMSDGSYQYILVDAGTSYGNDDYTNVVSEINGFMENKGIVNIGFEYVIISHYDSDHINMLEDILINNNVTVGTIYCRRYDDQTITKLQNASNTPDSSDYSYNELTPMYNNYQEVNSIINQMPATTVVSPDYDTQTIYIGKYIQDANNQYTAVRVSLRFLNSSNSYFSNLDTTNDTYSFDWRLASNNDSLVFVLRYYDPSNYGSSEHVKKILFCGDIQGNAMADYLGKTYSYDESANEVNLDSSDQSGDLARKFEYFASKCDLVMWPHHGKILGAENYKLDVENNTKNETLKFTTIKARDDFAKAVGNGEDTICFVSTNTVISGTDKAAERWNEGKVESVATFDVPSLKQFRDDSHYTSCLANNQVLMAEFDVINETAEVKVFDSTLNSVSDINSSNYTKPNSYAENVNVKWYKQTCELGYFMNKYLGVDD